MEKLPKQISDRFSSIYSKKEMTYLETVFLLKRRPVSFRVNTLKSNLQEVEGELTNNSIAYKVLDFPKEAILLDEKYTESDIWKLSIYKLGKIYMQSISSQVPVAYFSKENFTGLKILDACAAPGGKTSQLSALYPDATIYAFEPQRVRYDKMRYNLKKLWCENVECIHDEIRNIWEYIQEENYFDMILVDAPCSSEGSLSLHNDKFLKSWDISHINKNYKRQKFIVSDIVPYLKDGWEFIYSTCTLAPEENEAVVHYLLSNFKNIQLENIDLWENKYIKHSNSLKGFESKIFKTEISEKTLRVIPSEYSEGFYIAKFRKCLKQ